VGGRTGWLFWEVPKKKKKKEAYITVRQDLNNVVATGATRSFCLCFLLWLTRVTLMKRIMGAALETPGIPRERGGTSRIRIGQN
jgi:hypothetical protein